MLQTALTQGSLCSWLVVPPPAHVASCPATLSRWWGLVCRHKVSGFQGLVEGVFTNKIESYDSTSNVCLFHFWLLQLQWKELLRGAWRISSNTSSEPKESEDSIEVWRPISWRSSPLSALAMLSMSTWRLHLEFSRNEQLLFFCSCEYKCFHINIHGFHEQGEKSCLIRIMWFSILKGFPLLYLNGEVIFPSFKYYCSFTLLLLAKASSVALKCIWYFWSSGTCTTQLITL